MNNIARIQQALRDRKLDAVLITDEKNQRFAAGFPFTDGAVLVARHGAWLITDSRYIEAASAQAEGVEVRLYDARRSLTEHIKDVMRAQRITALAAEDKRLSHAEYLSYEAALGVELLSAGDMLSELRASKSDEEIACIRAAQAISEAALEEVLHLVRPGLTERELASELVYRMLRRGAEAMSFDPIVVTGSKTSMPHGVPGDKIVQTGDFITMDFGCVKNGYCSDMTRTVAVGSVTDEMRNVYDVVLHAQLVGIKAARAGIPGREIDAAARKVIAEAGFGDYFGHGFGHSLGLDIHEAPNANPRGEALMPIGAVCSAEPGIYLPGRFGVRIEDIMVLREGGCEVLTKAPKALIIL